MDNNINKKFHRLLFVSIRHPYKMIVLFLILTALSIYLSFNYLETHTSRRDLVSDDQPFSQRFTNYTKEFGSLDALILVVEGETPTDRERFIEALASRLNGMKGVVEEIYYRTPITFFKEHGMLYLSDEEFKMVTNRIYKEIPNIKEFPTALGFNKLFKRFKETMDFLLDPAQSESVKRSKLSSVGDTTVLLRILNDMEMALTGNVPDTYISPLESKEKNISLESMEKSDYSYIVSKNNDMHFMMIYPHETSTEIKIVRRFIERVEKSISETKKTFTGINVGMTGPPALSYEETEMYRKDTITTSIVALLAVGFLFMIGFHSFIRPLVTLLLLIVAIALTFGLAAIFVGHLNLLSMSCSLILIGLGIDFGIHIVARYEEEWLKGVPVEDALEASLPVIVPGITVGALTTAVAFFTLILTGFKGYEELGLIAGIGVLVCLFTMIWLLPAVLKVIDRQKKSVTVKTSVKRGIFEKLFNFVLNHSKLIILLSGLLTGLSIIFSGGIYFDYSLMNLQAAGTKSVEYEYKMINNTTRSPRYATLVVNDYDDLLDKVSKLKELKTVGGFESILSSLPKEEAKRLIILEDIRKKLKDVTLDMKGIEHLELNNMFDDLWGAAQDIDQIINYYAFRELPPEAVALKETREIIGRILQRIHKMDKDVANERLVSLQKKIFLQKGKEILELKKQVSTKGVSVSDVPDDIKKRFIGKTGKLQILVFPKGDIWDKDFFYNFIEDVKGVDKEVTGLPLFLYDATELMKNGTVKAGVYSAIVIFILLLLDFKNIRLGILGMVPLSVGLMWMVGSMRIFGMNFNPANIISLPLILGIGVDNGVHILHRYLQDKEHNIFDVLKGTCRAIFLCSMTTILSFAGMSLAHHKGLASLGEVLVIGVSMCLITAILLLPAILTLFRNKKPYF